jgi:uncharacterized membrane protein
MSKTTKFLSSIAVGIAALSVASYSDDASAKKKVEMEKCYGVVKAGQNDCGNASGTHSCAGQAKADSAAGEWLLLPEGTCSRITGGSTKAKS